MTRNDLIEILTGVAFLLGMTMAFVIVAWAAYG